MKPFTHSKPNSRATSERIPRFLLFAFCIGCRPHAWHLLQVDQLHWPAVSHRPTESSSSSSPRLKLCHNFLKSLKVSRNPPALLYFLNQWSHLPNSWTVFFHTLELVLIFLSVHYRCSFESKPKQSNLCKNTDIKTTIDALKTQCFNLCAYNYNRGLRLLRTVASGKLRLFPVSRNILNF